MPCHALPCLQRSHRGRWIEIAICAEPLLEQPDFPDTSLTLPRIEIAICAEPHTAGGTLAAGGTLSAVLEKAPLLHALARVTHALLRVEVCNHHPVTTTL